MWFNLAAANGYDDAIKNHDLVAMMMKPDEIIEADRLAGDWQKAHPKP